LPSIIKEDSPNDVFNIDETTLFFKRLPDGIFILKGKNCSCCKQKKAQKTILL
jgi:hypothetical protein